MKNIILFILLTFLFTTCDTQVKSIEKEGPDVNPKKELKMPEGNPKEFGFKYGENPKKNPLPNSQQIMITILPDDKTVEGKMYRFEKNNEEWISEGEAYPVNIGKHGLAWGKGGELSDNVKRGFFKQEGDGKAPAGIFTIGSAFGKLTEKEIKTNGIKLPFIDVADHLFCVDDVKSEHYNTIVSTDNVPKDWESAEEMLRKDELYDLGVFVNHNTPSQAGDGSCIIIHVWRAKGKPTHGCTATTKENMMSLLKWLNPEKNPLLIQITEKEYPKLQEWFALPDLQ